LKTSPHSSEPMRILKIIRIRPHNEQVRTVRAV
jgi:hypothetical protein